MAVGEVLAKVREEERRCGGLSRARATVEKEQDRNEGGKLARSSGSRRGARYISANRG